MEEYLDKTEGTAEPNRCAEKTWSLQIGEPTELINVQKFLDSFSLELGHEEESIRCDSKLSEKLNKKQLKEIREKCSVKEYFKLSSQFFAEPSAMEIKFMEMTTEMDSSPLASLRDANRTRNSHMKRADLNYLSSVKFSKPNKPSEPQSFENKPEAILSVAFYNQSKTSTRTQEFLVLGSQPLTALRDAFYCLRDFYKLEPWEQPKPTTILNATNRKMSPSYFFIENVFYNDLRDPRAVDYSSKTMENVTFNELSIKLNQPYLFVHQGDCQHAVVFRDLRLKQAYDDPDPAVYPKAIFRGKIGRHKCRMCMQRPAM
ncbi:8948_t:CDS:2 [Dentiscutata erythropus]|uniref:8948_t:CDS:1 n=1 Tax=Dentiscutata erythropus TaxID=1348616 RepID=A0A9N9CR66_9GLOM|nr:8948_t:CDS:2 [Dentiscutata erythropus]